jgi:MFS family permease
MPAKPLQKILRTSRDYFSALPVLTGNYALLIFVITTFGLIIRIPSNANGLAVFTESFMANFELSRTELSSAYLVGMLSTALFMPMAGRLYDKHGARKAISFASVLLGLSFLLISQYGAIKDLLNLTSTGMTALMAFGYFLVGLFGQGVITSACRNLLITTIQRRLGLMSSLQNFFLSSAFAVCPLLLLGLLSTFKLQGALIVIAAATGILFSIISWTKIQPKQEDQIELIDPEIPALPLIACTTVKETIRTRLFWLYSLSNALPFYLTGALVFHAISIFSEAGRTSQDAFSWLIPSTTISLVVMLVAGSLVDKMKLRPYLIFTIGSFLTAAIGSLLLKYEYGYWMLVIGWGLGSGLRLVVFTQAQARLFDPKNIGAITGIQSSFCFVAGAIGPAAMAYMHQVGDNYFFGTSVIVISSGALLLFSALTPREEREMPRSTPLPYSSATSRAARY